MLEPGVTGARFLRTLLAGAQRAFPDDLAQFSAPADDATCRARLAELVPQFEALRSVSAQRSEIARALCLEAGAQLQFVDEQGQRTLSEALAQQSEPLPLVRVDLGGAGRLRPCVDLRGRHYEGEQVAVLAGELLQAHFATRAAAAALEDVVRRAESSDGLSLAGQRFVLIGAGAQLSPVYSLLEAGAEVLWIDLHNPPVDHLLEPHLRGALLYVDGGVDLLAQPAAVRATIEQFARGAPVHLGQYAFAPGDARALRLELTFLELVRALDPALLASLLFLLSPTSASPVSSEDAALADERRQRASALQRALLRTGPLSRAHLEAGDGRVSCAVVSQQGASFQIAEYVGKRLAAEALSEYGSTLTERAVGSLNVSVNMAPISATRSLASPLLEAAILDAPRRDMLIAEPSTSRAISALLSIHDVLRAAREPRQLAELSHRERMRALFSQQFHGGVYAQPFALEGLIRVAKLWGITQRPKLAFELLR